MLDDIIAWGARNARAALATLQGSQRLQAERVLAQASRTHFVSPDAVALLEKPTQHTDPVLRTGTRGVSTRAPGGG